MSVEVEAYLLYRLGLSHLASVILTCILVALVVAGLRSPSLIGFLFIFEAAYLFSIPCWLVSLAARLRKVKESIWLDATLGVVSGHLAGIAFRYSLFHPAHDQPMLLPFWQVLAHIENMFFWSFTGFGVCGGLIYWLAVSVSAAPAKLSA